MDKLQKEFESFAKNVHEYSSRISQDNLRKAFEFGRKVHADQKRFSGDPIMSHCLEAAKLLATLKVDEETLIAALLQEVLDYTDNTISDIEKNFGHSVSVLVSRFKKISTVRASVEEDDSESLRNMFLVMAKDLRVVLIKLADRLHNMQTLEFVQEEKRKRIARETLDIYVPIASRLGVYRFRSTLEDLCFKFLNEDEYNNIKEELKALGKKRKNAIDEIKTTVEDFIRNEFGFEAEVKGRFKNIYSIYKKLKQKGRTEV
ncbi:HD domain-containing protein, partial [Patescibacteria group bacterium]|nr:HD domain-containing protein [Patescibacteria group bacterium]